MLDFFKNERLQMMNRREFIKKAISGIITGGLFCMNLKLKSVLAEAEGEGILIIPERNCLVRLNETGLYVYKRLQEGYKPEEIAKLMANEYDVTEEKALEDVYDFIASMEKKGLINEKAI